MRCDSRLRRLGGVSAITWADIALMDWCVKVTDRCGRKREVCRINKD